MSAKESYHQAARCLQNAEETRSTRLKGLLLASAQAWNRLAEEQDRFERLGALSDGRGRPLGVE